MNREQTLHEMGLGPFWKLRVPPVDIAAPAVTSAGDVHADWLFIGNEPDELDVSANHCEEPFVGQASTLLDAMLAAIGLVRGQDVFLASAGKSRPNLAQQIALVQPKLIVALGRLAAQAVLQNDVEITAARGKLHTCNGIPVIVSYHPADLLRNPLDKALAWEDLCFMRRTMRQLKATSVANSVANSVATAIAEL